jgi:hypothetical protein
LRRHGSPSCLEHFRGARSSRQSSSICKAAAAAASSGQWPQDNRYSYPPSLVRAVVMFRFHFDSMEGFGLGDYLKLKICIIMSPTIRVHSDFTHLRRKLCVCVYTLVCVYRVHTCTLKQPFSAGNLEASFKQRLHHFICSSASLSCPSAFIGVALRFFSWC